MYQNGPHYCYLHTSPPLIFFHTNTWEPKLLEMPLICYGIHLLSQSIDRITFTLSRHNCTKKIGVV